MIKRIIFSCVVGSIITVVMAGLILWWNGYFVPRCAATPCGYDDIDKLCHQEYDNTLWRCQETWEELVPIMAGTQYIGSLGRGERAIIDLTIRSRIFMHREEPPSAACSETIYLETMPKKVYSPEPDIVPTEDEGISISYKTLISEDGHKQSLVMSEIKIAPELCKKCVYTLGEDIFIGGWKELKEIILRERMSKLCAHGQFVG